MNQLLLEGYSLLLERRFAGPKEPDNYAGRSIGSW
jgi:hypothetical protein